MYLTWFFIAGCAGFFFHHGEQERRGTGFLWGAGSLTLSLGALYFLGWGLAGCFGAQLGLFMVATGMKMGWKMPAPRGG